ncbi:unnamed protein product [Calypogeia fissa]
MVKLEKLMCNLCLVTGTELEYRAASVLDNQRHGTTFLQGGRGIGGILTCATFKTRASAAVIEWSVDQSEITTDIPNKARSLGKG